MKMTLESSKPSRPVMTMAEAVLRPGLYRDADPLGGNYCGTDDYLGCDGQKLYRLVIHAPKEGSMSDTTYVVLEISPSGRVLGCKNVRRFDRKVELIDGSPLSIIIKDASQ